MQHRSHTPEEVRAAMEAGEEVWALDTGSDGLDDVLIGSELAVWAEICDWVDGLIPVHWTLTKVEA